jgi:hypothetical protein
VSEKFGKINSPGDCLLASEYSRLMTMSRLTVITVPDKCSHLDSVNSQITTRGSKFCEQSERKIWENKQSGGLFISE